MQKSRALLLAAAFALAACGPQAGENAGEAIDNTADDLTRNQRDLTEGPAEKAGENIDAAAAEAKAKADAAAAEAKERLERAGNSLEDEPADPQR